MGTSWFSSLGTMASGAAWGPRQARAGSRRQQEQPPPEEEGGRGRRLMIITVISCRVSSALLLSLSVSLPRPAPQRLSALPPPAPINAKMADGGGGSLARPFLTTPPATFSPPLGESPAPAPRQPRYKLRRGEAPSARATWPPAATVALLCRGERGRRRTWPCS